MDIQENLLNWALSATMDQRVDFLHKYLQVIPASELDKVIKKAQGAKKRDRRNVIGNDKERVQSLKKKLKSATESALRDQILHEIEEAQERRRVYEQSKSKDAGQKLGQGQSTSKGAQAVSSEALAVPAEDWKVFPMNNYVAGTCFEKYFPTNYVFLDCELVLKHTGEYECGSVAVLDHNRKTIYKTRVYHPANSFNVNYHTISCNGFHYDSLANEKYPRLDEVSDRVEKLIHRKLVILIGGDNGKANSYNDLISLKLDASNITVYNLHFHFFKTTIKKNVFLPMGDEESAFIIEPISLRRLSMKYFDVDMQSVAHDPETDAKYTAKLFQEILPLQLKPGLKEFVEYDMKNMCAYEERYAAFDDDPKMIDFNSKIRAAGKRKAPRKN